MSRRGLSLPHAEGRGGGARLVGEPTEAAIVKGGGEFNISLDDDEAKRISIIEKYLLLRLWLDNGEVDAQTWVDGRKMIGGTLTRMDPVSDWDWSTLLRIREELRKLGQEDINVSFRTVVSSFDEFDCFPMRRQPQPCRLTLRMRTPLPLHHRSRRYCIIWTPSCPRFPLSCPPSESLWRIARKVLVGFRILVQRQLSTATSLENY